MVSMDIQVPNEVLERLNKVSQLTGKSKTYYITTAIEEKLSELEMICLAKQRAEDVRSGRSETYTLNEVLDRNGLAD